MALIKIKQVDGLSSIHTAVDLSIDALEASVGSIDTRVSTAEGDISTNADDIDALEASVGSVDTRVSTAEGDISTNADDIDALEASVGSVDTRVSTAESGISTNADDIDALEASVGSIDTRVSTAESGISTNAGDIDALEASVGSIDTRVLSLEAVIIEDDEFFVQNFAGTPNLGPYALNHSVQDNEVELVWAYVNGVSVEVATVTANSVTLVTPGYAIDANDTVKFHYQRA